MGWPLGKRGPDIAPLVSAWGTGRMTVERESGLVSSVWDTTRGPVEGPSALRPSPSRGFWGDKHQSSLVVKAQLQGGLESTPTPRAPDSSQGDRAGTPTLSPFLAHAAL